MGKRSVAPKTLQVARMSIGEALEGSDAQKAEALCAVVETHEETGRLPEGVGIEEVARAAIGMDWGYTTGNPGPAGGGSFRSPLWRAISMGEKLGGMGAEEIPGTLFNLKLRVFALLDAEAKTPNSARMLEVFCGEKINFDLSNVSFARGALISAFGAGQCSGEAVEAALNFIRSGAVCPEDKETMLGVLLDAQQMGADLSSAKSALEGIAGNGVDKSRKFKVLARSILLGIDGGKASDTLLRRSWTPRGHAGSRRPGPAGRARGKGEPTGKMRV